MATILIAASPVPRALLESILAGHELFFAETIADAQVLLGQRPYQLIVCTVLFDESRMFDLIRRAKGHLEWSQIPFACVRVKPIFCSVLALEGIAFTCCALGAAAFLDIADHQVDPNREMRDALELLMSR